MSKVAEAIKAGVKAASIEFGPGKFKMIEKAIACPHCGNEVFEYHPTVLFTLFRFATVPKCTDCHRLEWYTKRPTRV